MKKILLILAFITPLLTTLLAIIYTLNLEDRNEGVIVGLGILIIIATLECIAYGVVLINCMFQKVERKAIENLEVSN